MGEKLSRLLRCVIILIGVGILVYPSLSEYLSEKNGSRATASYDDSVSKMQQQEIDAELEAARAYNRALFEEGSGVASIDTDEAKSCDVIPYGVQTLHPVQGGAGGSAERNGQAR